jgi:hypothetical protein
MGETGGDMDWMLLVGIVVGSVIGAVVLLAVIIKLNEKPGSAYGHRPPRPIPGTGDVEQNPIPKDDPQT